MDLYDLALRQPHLARLSVGSATGRDVLQVFRVELADPGDEYATFDVRSSRAWDRNPNIAQAVAANETPADYASDVLAAALDDTLDPPFSSDVDALIVCDMAVTEFTQPVLAHLDDAANVALGWWWERWDGGIHLQTFAELDDPAVCDHR